MAPPESNKTLILEIPFVGGSHMKHYGEDVRTWLACILLLSLVLNVYGLDFPLGYHADEAKKVRYIVKHTQDFQHPILMLNVVRALNLLFDFDDRQDVALLGRATTAVFGTLIVLVTYLMARTMTSERYALLTALGTAVAPTLVVHSHYLKEDILVTLFALTSLYQYMRWTDKPTARNLVLLAVATGLAVSSHYKGYLLLVFYVSAPLVVKGARSPGYYKKVLVVFLISCTVFVVVNYPALTETDTFIEGLEYEINHSRSGHTLVIYPVKHLFSYHLSRSVVPGITAAVTLGALAYISLLVIRWKKAHWRERLVLLYVVIFYVAVESSPSKPYPDFMRYVLPIVPPLILFAFKAVSEVGSSQLPRKRALVVLLCGLFIVFPLYESVRLDLQINSDTREISRQFLKDHEGSVLAEKYTTIKSQKYLMAEIDIEKAREENVTYLVASSFTYDRYLYGGTLGGPVR